MIRLLGTLFAALSGLCFGSFLNVCLSRWPEQESVVQPRSHCRNCTHTLSWWENIPLLSWIILCGRCRLCRTWIGWRYPVVEAAVGGLWALATWQALPEILFPHPFDFYLYRSILSLFQVLIFDWLLVALAIFDYENLWLPNRVTIPGLILGCFMNLLQLILAVTMPLPFGYIGFSFGIVEVILKWVAGILVAAGFILLIRWLYWVVRKREGLGLGDAKLMALLAAWLGLPQTILAFVIGVFLGALAAVFLLAQPASRREAGNWAAAKLPLGTFLCIGGIVSSLWGQPILAAYLRWAGL